MEHLDEKIVNVIKGEAEKVQKEKDFGEKLKEIIEEIKTGKVLQDSLDMEVEPQKFFGKKFTIYIPQFFKKMDFKQVKIKYPNENRPKIIFTNKKDTINIGLNLLSQESFTNDDLLDFRDVMKNSFLSVSPSSRILDEGNFTGDENTQIAYYCFDSFAIGGPMNNLVYVTVIDTSMLVINLNCLKKDWETYKLLFYGIMHTSFVSE